jgi:hypothetical protein
VCVCVCVCVRVCVCRFAVPVRVQGLGSRVLSHFFWFRVGFRV